MSYAKISFDLSPFWSLPPRIKHFFGWNFFKITHCALLLERLPVILISSKFKELMLLEIFWQERELFLRPPKWKTFYYVQKIVKDDEFLRMVSSFLSWNTVHWLLSMKLLIETGVSASKVWFEFLNLSGLVMIWDSFKSDNEKSSILLELNLDWVKLLSQSDPFLAEELIEHVTSFIFFAELSWAPV